MADDDPPDWPPGHVFAEPPREWIFTFGYGHEHPVTGDSLASMFVRITGTDAEARREMEARFGVKWAFQYASEAEAGVERFGLVELGQDEAHVELLKKLRAELRAPERERTSVPSDDRTVVHVLHEGRAFCGKPGVPGSWGPGHKWVRRDSDEGGPRSAVNCLGCIAAWSKWADTGTWDPFEPEQPATLEGHERAVLAELALIPDDTLQSWIDRSFFTVSGLAKKELARRRFARANPAPPPIDADFPEPKPELPRTRELLRRFVAKWNASEQDPRTLGGEVDFDLLADIADAFEAEDLEE